MKYTRSAITQLSKWYKQVLIRCAKYNAAVLVGVVVAATGASATVTPDFTNRVLTIDRQTGRVSSFALDELEDFQTLIIRNNSDVNFDKPALFISDKNDQRHYLLETDSSYPKYKEFTDQIEYDDDDEEDGTVHSYENQIYGQMTLDNSRLTLQSNMAADVFEVTNGATLSATDYIIGGRTLNVNQNSTVSLGASYLKFMNSGFDENVTVNNGSTLNIQKLTVGDCSMYGCPQGRLQILNNSNFNVTNGELTGNTLKVQDSSMSLNNSRMRLRLNDSSNTIDLSNADVSLNNYSYVFEDGITSIASSDVDVKNHSTLSGVTMNITNDSEITAEDSHVGAFKRAVKVDHEDKDISLKLGNGTYLPEDIGYNWQSDLTVSNSTINLKGTSELGTGLAIVEYNNHLTNDEYTEEEKITGYITQEMANNQSVLFNKYRGYAREDFGNSLAFTKNYKSAVNISGSSITMEGTSSIVNAMLNVHGTSGDINITNGSMYINGNNTLNATGNVNIEGSYITVESGATLNAISLDDEHDNNTIRVSNSNFDVHGVLNTTVIDDNDHDSTLNFYGYTASSSKDAYGFGNILFWNADTSLINQTLEANHLEFEDAKIDLLGGVSLKALSTGIQLTGNSLISVKAGLNTIEALNQNVLLENSDINIYKGATLSLNVGEEGEIDFNNGHIRVEGTLNGNARTHIGEITVAGDGIIEGQINVNNVNYDQKNETIAAKYEDVSDLAIINGSNIIIKNADTFKVTDESAKRLYETGKYQGKTYYADECDGVEEEDAIKTYENQILGKLTVSDGSKLTLSSNFAAKDIRVDNATLNAVDYIIGGETLTLLNGATVDLSSNKRLVNSGFTNRVYVSGGSTLKVSYLKTGIDTDDIDWSLPENWDFWENYRVSNLSFYGGSTLEASNGEIYSEDIRIVGSTLKLSNVRFKSEGPEGHGFGMYDAIVQSDRSFIQSDGEVFVEGNSTNIVLDNHSTLTAEKTTIDGGQVVANNSDVGGFMHAIKIEDEDKEIKNRLANYYGQPPMGLDVSNSDITLQGTSNLGVGLAIVKWPVSYTGTIVGFVTDDLIENPNTLINQYRGYEVENFEDGNLERARDYRSTLNISGSSVSMEGTSSLINAMINTEDDSGDINITSSTIWAKGNNNLKASGDINIEDSTLTVQNGATLNVNSSDDQEYDDKTIYVSNTNVSVSGKLNATIVDDSNNDSTLTLSGKGASITGSVIGLDSIVLNSVENVLSDQTLEANSLDFDNTKLKLMGGVSLKALENGIDFKNNSLIMVYGTGNSIEAINQDILLKDSNINIYKNAILNLNVGDNGCVKFDNGEIRVAGTLTGNAEAQHIVLTQGGIIENARINDLDIDNSGKKNMSDIVTGVAEDVDNLNIINGSDVTLDKDGIFVVSSDHRIYETGSDGGKTYYIDQTDVEPPSPYEHDDDDIRDYDNQIAGDLTVDETSKLTLNSNFAANNITVDGGTLNVTDHLIGGKSLLLDNEANVNLLSSKAIVENGFDDEVTVRGGSKLNVSLLQVGQDDETGENSRLNVSEGSTFTVSNGNVYAGKINIEDSTLNVTKSRFKSEGARLNLENAVLNADAGFIQSDDLLEAEGSENIKLRNQSSLIGQRVGVDFSKITADNSVVGAFVNAIKVDKSSKELDNRLSHNEDEPISMFLDFTESSITLNGNSMLGSGLAITEWSNVDLGTGYVTGLITKEIAGDTSILFNQYKGYQDAYNDETGEPTFDRNGRIDRAYSYESFVDIYNSQVLMNGTSSIVNAVLNTGVNSGNIYMVESDIVSKGSNNLISAAADVVLQDSTLDVAKGATLTIVSDAAREDQGKTLNVVNSDINLGGVLNADLLFDDDEEKEASSLNFNGGRVAGTVKGLNEIDLSALTTASLKDTRFEDLENIVVGGYEDANGKMIMPKITFEKSIFQLGEDNENTRYYGYDDEENEYYDIGTYSQGGYKYENQIMGDLNIFDGASLTLTKALAAENINLKGKGSTFVSNNALVSANLYMSEESTATINGTQLGGLVLGDIESNSGSILNLNSIEFMSANSLISNNSTLNINKWTELSTNYMALADTKTTVTAGGAWIQADEAEISGGSMNIADADIKFLATSINGTDISLSKNTFLGVKDATISESTITLSDTSRLATGFNDGGAWTDYSIGSSNLLFENGSKLNLDGSSALELAVTAKMDDDSGRSHDEEYEDFDLDGNIIFNDSEVNMSGTSKIVNTANDSDVVFEDGSRLNVKGKNNTVTTSGSIYVEDSTLDVAQGATLSVDTGDDIIHLDNARIKLAGTLYANLDGTIDTMIFGANGKVEGDQHITGTINSFGVSGVNTKGLDNLLSRFRSDNMVTFEMTDNSNLNFDDDLVSKLSFDNLNVEASTLTISGDRELEGRLTADLGSTIKINNGTAFAAEAVYMADTALTVSGAALRRGETNYQTSLSTENGMHIDNTNNGKAAVSISNVEVGGDLFLNNVTKATLTNICAYDSFVNVSGDVIKDSKGNNSYKTATLTNVGGDVLNVDDAKVILQKSNVFENINASGEGYVDIKDSLTTDLSLEDKATAVLAAGKTLNGSVVLNDESTLSVQGTLQSNVQGEGLLNISNSKAKVMGDVDGVELGLSKMKGKISDIFKGDVENVMGARLASATMTLDKLNNFGDVKMEKSTITLTGNVSTSQLTMNGSTLNLGTNVFHVSGDAALTNKSTINLDVDSKTKYGQLNVDGSLLLDRDAKGNPTTNLAVTLKKGIALSKNDAFQFLNYGDVEGKLNKVTIKNNRYTFYEQEIGQFVITEAISGKAVVDRSNPALRNAMRTAAAFVDNSQSLGSDQQNNLAEGLNALSQVVGGEETYIQALNATNPDDNNMVSENTVNTVNTVLSAAADRISSGGISSSAQGMSSGDVSNAAALWTKVLYNHGKLDSSSVHDGFKSRNRGLAMGADKLVKDYLKLGLGYAFTKGKVTNAYRKSDVKTHTAMVYGEYKPSYWFVNGLASYGWSDYDSKAYSAIGVTKSDFDVTAVAIQLNTGYDVNMTSNTILTPVLGMRYMHITKDGYTDSDGKHIAKNNSNIVTALASAKLKTTFESGNGTYITPEARLGVTYDIKRDEDNSVVKLANGTSYVVEGRTLNRFALEAGLGVTAAFENGIEVSAGYEGRFRKDYRDHTGLINIKYNF